MVGGMPVGTPDDEVLDIGGVELDSTAHRIVEPGRARRDLEADGPRCGRDFELGDPLRREREAGAVVLPRFAALLGALALLMQSLRGAIAVVGVTFLHQAGRGLAITFETLRLEIGRMLTA